MPKPWIGGPLTDVSWIDAARQWLRDNPIPTLEDVARTAELMPGIPGVFDPKNISMGIDVASQAARPIGAVGGAMGGALANVDESVANVSPTNWGAEEWGRVGRGALEGLTGNAPEDARKTLNVLDVASFGAGAGAGALAKVAPKAAAALGAADLGLAGADATYGAEDLASGVEQGDWAKAAAGLFRVAGNTYGGIKAGKDLGGLDFSTKPGAVERALADEPIGVLPEGVPASRQSPTDEDIFPGARSKPYEIEDEELGVLPEGVMKPTERSFERAVGLDFTNKRGHSTTEFFLEDTEGAEFSVEQLKQPGIKQSLLEKERLRSAKEDPNVQRALAEQATLLRMLDVEDSDLLMGKLAERTGEDPLETYAFSGEFGGFMTEQGRRGVTFSGSDRLSTEFAKGYTKYRVNPWEIANTAMRAADGVLSGDVGELEAWKVWTVLEPENQAYVKSVMAGGDTSTIDDMKVKADLYTKLLLYTGAHERTLHLPKNTGHEVASGSPADYRTRIYSKGGREVGDITLHEVDAPEDLFGELHNWYLQMQRDPKFQSRIAQITKSENFTNRAMEWYRAMNPGDSVDYVFRDMPVPVRNDRVTNKAAHAEAAKEIAEGKAAEAAVEANGPTPPGDVPPGSPPGGGGPPEFQGPVVPPLAQRIKMHMQAQYKAAAERDVRRREIRTAQAEALREIDEELKSHRMTTEQHTAEQKRIMSGEMGLDEYVGSNLNILPEEQFALKEKILNELNRDRFEALRMEKIFEQMQAGKYLQDEQIAELERFLKIRLQDADAQVGYLSQMGNFFANATGGLRAIKTSWDLSAAGRQALFGSVMNPREAARAFRDQIKAIRMSDKEFDMYLLKLRDKNYNPFAEIAEQAGLHFSETNKTGGRSGRSEEAFTNSSWAESVPGVRASERAYIAYLNKIRVELFNKGMRNLIEQGIPVSSTEGVSQAVKDWAYAVNTLTGRGEMSLLHISPNSPMGKLLKEKEVFAPGAKKLNTMHQALTSVFFAPRFAASRAALLRDSTAMLLGGGNLDPAVYKMYMKNVYGTVAVISSTLAALQMMGVGEVETDPRRPDWGVLKVGKTRYDAYGGLRPWAKLFMLPTQDKYWTVRGQVRQYGQRGAKSKVGDVGRFLQGKLSPAASLLLEAYTGEDFTGQPSTALGMAENAAMPMILSTIKDAIIEGESDQLAVAVPAALVGIGVNTYDPFKR